MCLLDNAWVPQGAGNVNKAPIGRLAWFFIVFKLLYLGYKSGRGVFLYSCVPAGVEELHLL